MDYISGQTTRINGTYRYIRVRSYLFGGRELSDLSDNDLLQQVIEEPEFDSLFVGAEDSEDVGSYQGRGIHGPFDLSKLTPDLYERISVPEFRKHLQSHFNDPFYIQEDGPVSSERIAAVNEIINSLVDRSSRIFRLIIDRGNVNYLSEGRVHSDFDEYLFIEDNNSTIHFFIVAAD